MKGPLDRTKVVLRHLPPTITQSALMEQIDGRFSGRYNWFSFRPGKNSMKCQSYSRAYIEFKKPEDVIEFAEFFDGHVFVNEKGTQFKIVVEYAPSQRVPKQWSKKDGREGTICKDPEYLEFLEYIAKPVENLPSAEIQLERREAERASALKDVPIVTPLMDFVRQKRAVKTGSRRSLANGKLTRRASGSSSSSPNSAASKRGSDKRRASSTMYVLRDSSNSTSGKEKTTYVQVSKRDDHQLSEKSAISVAVSGNEALEEDNGASGSSDIGKKKILLLKGKEKEIPHVSAGLSLQQSSSAVKNANSSTSFKQNQHREASGRIIRSILLNKDTRQSHLSSAVQSEMQTSNQDRDKRPPRPPHMPMYLKDANGGQDDKVLGNDLLGFYNEKQDKRTRNKDRPDRGVWTPLQRSEGSHTSDESLSSSTSQSAQQLPDTAEGIHGEAKYDISNSRSGEFKSVGGRGGHFSVDNGSHKHGGRRGSVYNTKDADGSLYSSEGKPVKRGVSSGYGSHEKQVWVQKSSSGS